MVNNHAFHARAYYAEQASGTSLSMKNVSRSIIYGLAIPLPPIAEQHRIVAKVHELMALCDRLEAQLTLKETETVASSRRSSTKHCRLRDGVLGPDRVSLPHEHRAEVLLCFVGIVRAAAKLEIVGSAAATGRVGHDVMEFQEAALGAATVRTDKPALPAVPRPDIAPHRSGDMSRTGCCRSTRSRAVGATNPPLFQLSNQQRQSALDDGGRVAARYRVPEEILRAAQLVVGFAGNRDLEFVAFRRERADNGRPGRRWRGRDDDWGLVGQRLGRGRHPAAFRWFRRRELSNNCGNRWLRVQPGDQVLDLALALVSRILEKCAVVVRRQVPSEQVHRREVNRTVPEQVQDQGELPSRPCGVDATVGRVLGKVQHARAVDEQR